MLLKNGHLREFLSDRAKNNYGRNRDNTESLKVGEETPSQMINMIFGGNENSGVTFSAAKKTKVSITHSKRLREDDITFMEEDTDRLLLPYNNALETQEEVNPSREHVIDIPEPIVPKAKAPMPRPPPSYPQRLSKQNSETQFKKFIDMMKSLSINVPLVEALEQMPDYAKLMKDLVTKKRSMNCETIKMTHQVGATVHSMAPKLKNPGAFTIPCTIGSAAFAKALCDLGASINLIPYSVLKTLGIGKSRPISMRLQIVDRTMKRSLGIINDVLVRVYKFILSTDFVILDCEVDYGVPIILGRPFLAMGKALVDMEAGDLTFRVGDDKVVFHVCKSMRQPNSNEVCSFVDLLTEVLLMMLVP
ncbi:uncharacterized protein [Nicotiana tomentosiformis]|uniref:uncharacterized protein n=1 Tax=Nicotiana tomentosiformis TaxID=4098 RepID=UPI00388C5927